MAVASGSDAGGAAASLSWSSRGGLRATFLPSVWDSLPEAGPFLAALKGKAGIPPDLPPEKAFRYTAESFSEADSTGGSDLEPV